MPRPAPPPVPAVWLLPPYSEAKMPNVDQVEVILANNDRVTLRVGDVFLKIDADQRRIDVEVEAMVIAPVPTPEVLWRKPPALAIAAGRGEGVGRLGGAR